MIYPDGLPPGLRGRAMLTLCIAICMAVLDSAIANVALPTVAADLHASPASAIWVINAYQLAITISLLPLAALGEAIGYRRVYTAGLAVFTATSLMCALSRSLDMLVAARFLQGFGAAGVMGVNTALVRFVQPSARLGRGLALVALMVATSAAAGPSIASGILSVAPWPFLFAVNVPLGLLALSVVRALPDTPQSGRAFDFASAGLNALTFGLLIVSIDALGQHANPAIVAAAFALALLAGFVFLRRQLRIHLPMLPVDLLRIPLFALSVGTSICSYAAQMLAFVSLPFFFESTAGMSQVRTGLLITPWPLTVMVISPIAGRLADRYSARVLGGCGLAAMTLGLLSLLLLPADAGTADIAWRMALSGLGFGFFQSPNNRALISSAPRERSGAASGMLSTSRLLGQTFGAALVALSYGIVSGAHGAMSGAAIGRGTRLALAAAVGFAATGTVVSWFRPSGVQAI